MNDAFGAGILVPFVGSGNVRRATRPDAGFTTKYESVDSCCFLERFGHIDSEVTIVKSGKVAGSRRQLQPSSGMRG
jgi:hypothetical protein